MYRKRYYYINPCTYLKVTLKERLIYPLKNLKDMLTKTFNEKDGKLTVSYLAITGVIHPCIIEFMEPATLSPVQSFKGLNIDDTVKANEAYFRNKNPAELHPDKTYKITGIYSLGDEAYAKVGNTFVEPALLEKI